MATSHTAETDVLDRAAKVLYLMMVLDHGFEWRSGVVEVLVDLATGVGASLVVALLFFRDEYTHVSDHLLGLGEAGILEVENTEALHAVLHECDDLHVEAVTAHIKLGAVDGEVAVRHWKFLTFELRFELGDSGLDVFCIFSYWWR